MDDRTSRLLEVVDALGASLLLELLRKPATENELRAALPSVTQPTVNRRLDRLRQARLIDQEAGKPRAPGRLWTVIHPQETEALLDAIFALADTVDARDRARRADAKARLKQARARRLGIRVVPESGSVRQE